MSDYILPRKPEPSQEYVELLDTYKEMHRQKGIFKGISLIPFVPIIGDIIKKNKCETLFDYGCGKGIPYTKDFKAADPTNKHKEFTKPVQDIWNIKEFFLYDPACPEYNKLPTKKYDIVLCTDVLEHIPEDDLDWVIRDVLSYANKIAFINVCSQEAKKTFLTGKHKGRNVHVSIFSHEWWTDKCKHIWKTFPHLKLYLATTTSKGLLGSCIKGEKKNVKSLNKSITSV
jgi:hypothetical protein